MSHGFHGFHGRGFLGFSLRPLAIPTGWAPWVVLGTVCALVIGFFAWSARPGWLEVRTWHVDDAYYNLLVRGFRAGQLDLKTEVPAGFAQVADPQLRTPNTERPTGTRCGI